MTKILFHITVIVLMAGPALWGCSSNSGEEDQRGAIREMTDEVAHDLSRRIKDPINKARAAKNQEQGRLDELEDTAEETSRVD
jgi:hypothetical protein